MSGSTGFAKVIEISSSKFNTYLQAGQIEKVLIYDKATAEVYLTKAALSEKVHSEASKLEDKTGKLPEYVLEIGNEELFQKKLEDAEARKIPFQHITNYIGKKIIQP